MKVRTKEQLVDLLNGSLGWRKKELTTLYNNISTSSSKTEPTSIRSALVLLYAHWEGYIKNATEYYLNYIKHQGLTLSQLNPNLLAYCLKQRIHEFETTDKATLHTTFIEYLQNKLHEKANILPVVNTKSNLSSSVLKQIFAIIGLDFSPYELKSNLIDTQLLEYRNTIAHGHHLLINKEDYEILYKEVMSMLDRMTTDISNAVVNNSFKK